MEIGLMTGLTNKRDGKVMKYKSGNEIKEEKKWRQGPALI
jgi:hypothetical protein